MTSSCCLQGIQDGLDSGFHGDGFRILCEWILYFGFQSLAAFRNLELYSGLQNPGFRILRAKIFRVLLVLYLVYFF